MIFFLGLAPCFLLFKTWLQNGAPALALFQAIRLRNNWIAGLFNVPGNRYGFVVPGAGVLHVDKQREGIETEIDSGCFARLVLERREQAPSW